MNLPVLNQLKNNESTYIAFTKALLDLDEAITNGTEYYFSRVVALNLPVWENPNFFIDLSSVGVESTNPNICIPKAIQYYMENIIRQDLSNRPDSADDNSKLIQEVTELAFYKMLNKMGMSVQQIYDSIVFTNQVVTSNFIKTEYNNGWAEIICQIPNLCSKMTLAMRTVSGVKDIVTTNDDDTALYDNGNKQFLMTGFKNVIDFDNIQYDDQTQGEFKFNTLLLFYRDKYGIDKLHGINFIYPYENKVTYWDQVTFTQKTGQAQSIGYQFIFNHKTCNNEASLIKIYNQNEQCMWWNGFEKTLGGLNSFLEDRFNERELSKQIGCCEEIGGNGSGSTNVPNNNMHIGGCTVVDTLDKIPVTYHVVDANVAISQKLSLRSILPIGHELHIYITNNSSNTNKPQTINITIPDDWKVIGTNLTHVITILENQTVKINVCALDENRIMCDYL